MLREPSRRRGARVLTAAILAAALAIAGCGGSGSTSGGGDDGGSGSGADQRLTFSYMAGEQTPIGQLWTWWMDEIERRSGGSVTFDRFWDGTLLKSTETIDGLADGRADVAQVLPSVYPGRFPLTSAGELPFMSSNAPAVARAFTTLSEDGPLREEWTSQKLVPLAFSIGASSAMGTKFPVRTAEDLRGKRLRATDRGSKVLQSVGANLINIELAEIYGSMERGLVDGFYGIPFSFIGPMKFGEVSKQFTDTGIGVSTVNGLAMSQSGWDKLSDEQRRIVEEVSAEAPAKVAEFDQQFEEQTCRALREEGVDLYVLPDADVEKLRSGGQQKVVDEWKDEASGKGAPADQFLDEYEAELRRGAEEFPDYQTGVARCAGGGS